MGNIQCDCSFVQTQDVSNKSEEIKAVETRLRALSSPEKYIKDDHPTTMATDSELRALLKTCCYLREFLAKSHPLVGRKGPVCPFVPGSLRMDAMYLSVIHSKSKGTTTTFEEVEDVARSFVDRFHSLEPMTGKKAAYKAVVLIFPDIPPSAAPAIIDRVQLKLKPEFVSKGLMIGEFHENNNASMLTTWLLVSCSLTVFFSKMFDFTFHFQVVYGTRTFIRCGLPFPHWRFDALCQPIWCFCPRQSMRRDSEFNF